MTVSNFGKLALLMKGGGSKEPHINTETSSVTTASEAEPQDRSESSAEPPLTVFPESIHAETNEKWFFVCIVGLSACLSTISVAIYFPTLALLADDFNTTVSKINLTATIYSIFQGVSPILWGSLSDSWGRRPVYFCCALIYLAANISLANATTYAQLLGLRILQAFGGASTVTLVGGTIGDFSTRSTRGGLIGISTGISQLGNCFGPLIGSGIETQFNSWRAIFWALAIFAGIIFFTIFFFLPETNRHVVGNGSRAPLPGLLYILSRSPYAMVRRWKTGLPKKPSDPTFDDEWILPPKKIHWFRWAELFFQPRTLWILVPTAVHYTNWYMVLTAQSTVLAESYGFSTRNIGMTYLASGIGVFLSSVVTGKIMQISYQRESRYQPVNIYKARLGYSFYASGLEVASTLVFGWCLHTHQSFYAPVVMTFLVSLGAAFYLSTTSAILVDLFPGDSAASQSCSNLARCLLCAGGLAAVDRMMKGMTIGGCFTLMAGLCCLSSFCCVVVIHRYGPSRKQQTFTPGEVGEVTETNESSQIEKVADEKAPSSRNFEHDKS